MSAAGGGPPGGGDRSPQRKIPCARLGPPGQHGRLPGLGAGLCVGGGGAGWCEELRGAARGKAGPSGEPEWSLGGPSMVLSGP